MIFNVSFVVVYMFGKIANDCDFLEHAQYKMRTITVLYAVGFIYGSVFSVRTSQKGSKAENTSSDLLICTAVNYKAVRLMDRKGRKLEMEN